MPLYVVTTVVTELSEDGAEEFLRVATHCDPGALVTAITQNASDMIGTVQEAMGL